jgi:hypothetical protein
LPKCVRSPYEVNEGPLIGVGGQENLLSERLLECVQPSYKIQTLKHVQSALIHPHVILLVEVDKSGIECPVVRWRKCDAIPYMIHASLGADRDDMSRVHQSQLQACDCTTIPVCEENALLKSCSPAPTAHLVYDAQTLLGENLHLLYGERFLVYGAVEQAQNICFSTVAMEDCRIHGVSDKHIRPDADSDFVVALPVEAQSFGLCSLQCRSVDLNGWRPAGERAVPADVESCEQI